jgi:hypothetical protein
MVVSRLSKGRGSTCVQSTFPISHTKCLLPTACTALTDDDGCNPVVEAELPALLSLIIAQIRSRQSLGCRYFARPAVVCFHFSSLADQSTPVLTPRQPHLSISIHPSITSPSVCASTTAHDHKSTVVKLHCSTANARLAATHVVETSNCTIIRPLVQHHLQPRSARESDMNPDAESDWEYEYDDTEKEDVYFTLDLTTHVPNAIQEKQYAKNGKLIAPAAAERSGALTAGHGRRGDPDDEFDHPDANATSRAEAGQLQILDLHSEKPYVKFNNSFYSCYWFTDLGTQFWVTNPGVVAEPKYSGHVLDVVASSQARLVAMPANLKRKREHIDVEPTVSRAPTQPMEVDNDDASDVSEDSRYQTVEYFQQEPDVPMVIPRTKIKDPHLEAQANFMERLSALKLRKGEADAHKIPMRVPVYYKGAPNADELRAANGVNVDEAPRRLPRVPPPSTAKHVSPAKDNETGEGPDATDEGSPAVTTPKLFERTRGGSRGGSRRGGAPSHASRRSNLGLDLVGDQPSAVPKKRGRKSNVEKARLAAEAAAEAEAEGEAEAAVGEAADGAAADSKPFALDPSLTGGDQSPATPGPGEVPDEELSLIQESGRPPRKRRRNPEEMAEARRLEAERKAQKTAQRIAARKR